jgi:hypothetical protein
MVGDVISFTVVIWSHDSERLSMSLQPFFHDGGLAGVLFLDLAVFSGILPSHQSTDDANSPI